MIVEFFIFCDFIVVDLSTMANVDAFTIFGPTHLCLKGAAVNFQ